jgi:hypothetical protein
VPKKLNSTSLAGCAKREVMQLSLLGGQHSFL